MHTNYNYSSSRENTVNFIQNRLWKRTPCPSSILTVAADGLAPVGAGSPVDTVNGLVQDCSNSIANAMELLQSCAKPSKWWPRVLMYLRGEIYSGLGELNVWSRVYTCYLSAVICGLHVITCYTVAWYNETLLCIMKPISAHGCHVMP